MHYETSHIIEAAVVIALGIGFAMVYRLAINRILRSRLSAQHRLVLWRIGQYSVAILTLAGVLSAFGVDLSVLLGAAGVFTVALAFASQTSASNLISGLFLMGEQPFVIGDIIQVGQREGEVVDVGLLSVTLRTFDNLYVRLPNEALFKSEIVNLSRFPIRRCDLQIRGPYHADVDALEQLLLTAAGATKEGLDEPKPQIFVKGLDDYGINLQLSVWAARKEYLALRKSLHFEVLRAIRESKLALPYPLQIVELTPNDSHPKPGNGHMASYKEDG